MANVKDLSDEELVRLVCSRDQELYSELVGRYQDKLLRYVNYLVGGEHRVADVVQETFIKAFVNLRGFDVRKKFSSWIYRIAHNEAVNHLKKQGKELSLKSDKPCETVVGDTSVEGDFSRGELRKMVTVCLDKLPLMYRTPLVLSYLEGKTYEEISDILRLPVGTVGTRISRGKKLLAKVCRKEGLDTYVKS